jgi:hypothetical protein
MRFKQYLSEKTFDVDSDVDAIWEKHFKGLSKMVFTDTDHVLDIINKKGEWLHTTIDSGQLNTQDAINAHSVNPVTINIGILKKGNRYGWNEKVISLSINLEAVTVLNHLTQEMVMTQYPLWIKEFQKEQIKSAIAHELSHWISDSLHNRHIKKRMTGDVKEYGKLIKKLGNINASDFEIDAQIHGIKELKRQNAERWDEMTFDEMLKLKPSINNIVYGLQQAGKKVYTDWTKRLFGRMVRESLLGKNMKPITFGKYRK